jgi:DNA-directed RNA polymerase subunit M/transcription elongation factor TFIIS
MSNLKKILDLNIKDTEMVRSILSIIHGLPDNDKLNIVCHIVAPGSYTLFPDETILESIRRGTYTDAKQIVQKAAWYIQTNMGKYKYLRKLALYMGHMSKNEIRSHIIEIDSYVSKMDFESRYGQLLLMLDPNTDCVKKHGTDKILLKMIADKQYEAVANATEDNITSMHTHIRDEIDLRSKQTINLKTSTIYVCGKCGNRNIQYSEHQLRASDEASTLLCKCITCGFNFQI